MIRITITKINNITNTPTPIDAISNSVRRRFSSSSVTSGFISVVVVMVISVVGDCNTGVGILLTAVVDINV